MKDSLMKQHSLNISRSSGLMKALSVRSVKVLIITGFTRKTSFSAKVAFLELVLKAVE
ncbi:hypothetical protein SAMN06295967_105217 [Belliella buryatensis]|uniref:Uncharacterized protein n=1 Tax=Belliella buryatensis TaxID=1500549 RepID=A0A239CSS4_9BACT|nr:hypothetical protein SAMN06295967_105217 [Belliella buryatensis]